MPWRRRSTSPRRRDWRRSSPSTCGGSGELYFDVLGRSPTPGEVHQADTLPWRDLVVRLLSRPEAGRAFFEEAALRQGLIGDHRPRGADAAGLPARFAARRARARRRGGGAGARSGVPRGVGDGARRSRTAWRDAYWSGRRRTAEIVAAASPGRARGSRRCSRATRFGRAAVSRRLARFLAFGRRPARAAVGAPCRARGRRRVARVPRRAGGRARRTVERTFLRVKDDLTYVRGAWVDLFGRAPTDREWGALWRAVQVLPGRGRAARGGREAAAGLRTGAPALARRHPGRARRGSRIGSCAPWGACPTTWRWRRTAGRSSIPRVDRSWSCARCSPDRSTHVDEVPRRDGSPAPPPRSARPPGRRSPARVDHVVLVALGGGVTAADMTDETRMPWLAGAASVHLALTAEATRPHAGAIELLTGRPDPRAEGGHPRPEHPTLMERVREQENLPAERVWFVSYDGGRRARVGVLRGSGLRSARRARGLHGPGRVRGAARAADRNARPTRADIGRDVGAAPRLARSRGGAARGPDAGDGGRREPGRRARRAGPARRDRSARRAGAWSRRTRRPRAEGRGHRAGGASSRAHRRPAGRPDARARGRRPPAAARGRGCGPRRAATRDRAGDGPGASGGAPRRRGAVSPGRAPGPRCDDRRSGRGGGGRWRGPRSGKGRLAQVAPTVLVLLGLEAGPSGTDGPLLRPRGR